MPDTYIIDGYNLIHALGMIRKEAGPGGLEAARKQLLQFLAQSFGEQTADVTVVFDAKHAPRKASRDQVIDGITVHFAPTGQSSNDLIETLIGEHRAPRSLTVVSNDARLQTAARRRRARAWNHDALLTFLENRNASEGKTSSPAAEKCENLSPEDAKAWQETFADVENDPELKEYFDHDRFD